MMDESYLTGEPYLISKTAGSGVLSGAVNGEAALTIRVEKLPVDSRYARHARAARELACELFEARTVVSHLLGEIGVG